MLLWSFKSLVMTMRPDGTYSKYELGPATDDNRELNYWHPDKDEWHSFQFVSVRRALNLRERGATGLPMGMVPRSPLC
jgi:hypothetical protein